MGIIEIALTVWAWKRGWKAWALLPIAITFGIGMIIGAANPYGDLSNVIIFDFLCIAALVIMIIKKKGSKVQKVAGSEETPLKKDETQ